MKLKGFSLIEILLSLVVFSFICVLILKMFVFSSKLNFMAKEIDIATNLTINKLESIKSYTSIDSFFENNSQDNIEGKYVNKIFYDENWNIINYDENIKTFYILEINIQKSKEENKYNNFENYLYDIVVNVENKALEYNILKLNTKKYFYI